MQTKSKIVLAAIAILLIAGLARHFLGRNPESDREQIANQLQAAAVAAGNKDAPDVMSIVSDSYTDDADNNPERLNIMLRRAMSNVQNLTVDVAPPNVTVTGDDAVTTSFVTIKADGQVLFNQVLTLHWEKESTRRYFVIPDETWRVVRSDFSSDFD